MGKPTFFSTHLPPASHCRAFLKGAMGRALDRHATPGASPGRARSRAVAAPRRLRCDPVLPGQENHPKTIGKSLFNQQTWRFFIQKMGIDYGDYGISLQHEIWVSEFTMKKCWFLLSTCGFHHAKWWFGHLGVDRRWNHKDRDKTDEQPVDFTT